MAKIFRSVRQSLIEAGNIKRYIRYALGEIILVVLGILIALQIDTTYTNYQLEQTEVKYLGEIRNNLKFDQNDIQFNIDFNVKRLRSNLIVLQYLNKEIPYSDSVGYHLSNLPYSARTLPNSSTYETVKSKGLDIISNDSLRQQITTLYDFGYKNVIDFESKDDHLFQFGILLPEVVKSINVITVWKVARPINEEEILKNYPLKNAVTMNIHLRKYMLTYYKMLLRDVQKTIIAIENELKKKK